MRFLHTADWHLGRSLHGFDLIEDQAHFVERCYLPALDHHRPDAVVLAGDVFDRAMPPADAVALFDRAVAATVLERRIPMLVVAGNHDGPERLAAHRGILGQSGFHVVGRLGAAPEPVVVGPPGDEACFWLVPFPDCLDYQARRRRERAAEASGEAPARMAIPTHRECMEETVRQIEAAMDRGRRNVLVTHAMVEGSGTSSSERDVCIGQAESVPHGLFSGFDYVALGHIHRPQAVGRPEVRYSGSPLAYAFDEVAQAGAAGGKQMLLVELARGSAPALTRIPVVPRRPLAIVTGTADEVLAGPAPGIDAGGYVLVRRTDAGTRAMLAEKLRDIYPNLVKIEFAARPERDGTPAAVGHADRGRTTEDVIRDFIRECTPADLPEDLRTSIESALAEVLAHAQAEEREGDAR
jgi:exonuclease SbcD